ncbi:hypothetical protein M569_12941, partial [Genlisea aurea]
SASCTFCEIACSSTSTLLLHQDDRVVAFQDINPSAFSRHYLVIPIKHIPSVKNLEKSPEDFSLGMKKTLNWDASRLIFFFFFVFFMMSHMLNVGESLLQKDAPDADRYRLGFHQPPLYSVDHLHLHCLALPYTPRWRAVKYLSLGPFGGFIEASQLLKKLQP